MKKQLLYLIALCVVFQTWSWVVMGKGDEGLRDVSWGEQATGWWIDQAEDEVTLVGVIGADGVFFHTMMRGSEGWGSDGKLREKILAMRRRLIFGNGAKERR